MLFIVCPRTFGTILDKEQQRGAMKVAVTVWEDTVSTVCDFSSRLLVFDVMGDEVKKQIVHAL